MINALALQGLSKLQAAYRLRAFRIHRFKPKVGISIEVGPYLLKTVSTVEEMKAALRLRFEILNGGKNAGVDVDAFDLHSDHLIVMNKKTGRWLATQRLTASTDPGDFHSPGEFDLGRVLGRPGLKLEIGRPYFHRDGVADVTNLLLWRGISEFMTATGASLAFGRTSVKTDNPREAALLYRHFEQSGRMTPDFFATPAKAFAMPGLDLWLRGFGGPLTAAERTEVTALLPAHARSCLKAGAFIGGEPAWNARLGCIDFLTVLHREDLNRSLWKRYKLESGASFAS